jgi:hypothetical protein
MYPAPQRREFRSADGLQHLAARAVHVDRRVDGQAVAAGVLSGWGRVETRTQPQVAATGEAGGVPVPGGHA